MTLRARRVVRGFGVRASTAAVSASSLNFGGTGFLLYVSPHHTTSFNMDDARRELLLSLVTCQLAEALTSPPTHAQQIKSHGCTHTKLAAANKMSSLAIIYN